jgi:pimeloyl-ACP methyl ester carboxylesterase
MVDLLLHIIILRPEWDTISNVAQVVYYDQRGCGKSEKAACYSWQEHVLDLQRVIKTAAKVKKVYLIGSSWGYMPALLYAYTFPNDVKGMVLCGTVNWKGEGAAHKDCSAYIPQDKKAESERDSTFTMPFHVYRTYSDTATSNPIVYTKTMERHFFNFLFTEASLAEAPRLTQLKEIQLPILIFKGEDNCNGHADASKTLTGVLPGAKVVPVAGACHNPWYTHKPQVIKNCMEFIAK